MERLILIQQQLKATKDKKNTFGNYNYRSCEQILESVKPLLAETKTSIVISDEIVEIGGRVYVKATASLLGGIAQPIAQATAYAREEVEKKGMDAAQVTGAASSYARKYALNGLLAIDDNKDPDTDEYTKQQNRTKTDKPAESQKPAQNAPKSTGNVIIPGKDEKAAAEAKKAEKVAQAKDDRNRPWTEREKAEYEQAMIDMDNAANKNQLGATYNMFREAIFNTKLLAYAEEVCKRHGWSFEPKQQQ